MQPQFAVSGSNSCYTETLFPVPTFEIDCTSDVRDDAVKNLVRQCPSMDRKLSYGHRLGSGVMAPPGAVDVS